jgi:outer membrane protein TolC
MKRRLPLLAALVALAVAPACASNYQTLKGEVDSYLPSLPYAGQAGAGDAAATAPSAAAAAAPPAGAPVDGFAAAARRLQELNVQWEQSLQRPAADSAFLVPADELLRTLAGAAADPEVAGKALADGYSLQTLEALTLLRNPMIRTKQSEALAALAAFGQAEQIDAVLRRYRSLTSTAMAGLGAMEPVPEFPFPAVLTLKGQIVDDDVRAARERLEAARRDAVGAARTAYWELIYAGQAAEVTARMIDLLENLDRSVASRYESGKTSFQDLVRVRIEREKTRELLRTLTEERANRAAEIRGLLALPARVAVGTPSFVEAAAPLPAQAGLETLALARRQEVRAADAMVDRMERMLEMLETMTFPGFDLGLTPVPRGPLAPSAGGSAMGGAVAGAGTAAATSPVRPFSGAEQAYLGEVRQRIAALKSERESVRAQTLVDVRAAWFAADRARREEALYASKVLGLSQSALESALQGYGAGEVAFSDLLESFTGWLEANLARRRARADSGIARSGLEAAVGVANLEGRE